jgi:hypothetical protein
MRNLILDGLVFLLVGLMHSASYGDYTWYPYGGHNYALTLTAHNWVDAEAEAMSQDGHLATVNDSNELNFLVDTFKDAYIEWYGPTPSGRAVWIGLENTGTTWQWVTGEPYVGFPAPFTGVWHPSNAGPHAYLHTLYHPGAGTVWNDNDVDTIPSFYAYGIIENVPEPSTMVLLGAGTISLLAYVLRRRRYTA